VPELASAARDTQALGMFVVDEPTTEAIRRAWEAGGELAGVVELRRHFPLIADNANARQCVRAIVGWAPRPAPNQERPDQE
jgi:hypothetical protein